MKSKAHGKKGKEGVILRGLQFKESVSMHVCVCVCVHKHASEVTEAKTSELQWRSQLSSYVNTMF